MSPVDFKKINGNVPCHYFLNFPVDFKIVHCRLSNLRNDNVPCHYFLNFPVDFKRVLCCLSNLRKDHVALSNLRVKGHTKWSGWGSTNIPI